MKKRVNKQMYEDMRKYVKGLNAEEYESTNYPTDPGVIEYLRRYYAKNLPVDVDAWSRANVPDDDHFFAKRLNEQVDFVKNEVNRLFWPELDESDKPMVVATHSSQGVVLPVYQIVKDGVELTFKFNFYDWTISVNSEKELDFNFMGIVDPDEVIVAKKFPKEKIYGSYNQSKSQFTVRIYSTYKAYAFFLLLSNCMRIEK